ncbi:hypothetical protein Vi05172_g5062 [Venturia inaequalis]|nr:hypothetical protein Vi05172_g5062 [Venturia inaequalis]
MKFAVLTALLLAAGAAGTPAPPLVSPLQGSYIHLHSKAMPEGWERMYDGLPGFGYRQLFGIESIEEVAVVVSEKIYALLGLSSMYASQVGYPEDLYSVENGIVLVSLHYGQSR